MTEPAAAPSREQFRERRRRRRLERRRAWVGLPMVVAGLGLIGTGVYVWVENNRVDDPGVRVGGEVVERTTTSTSTTSSTSTTLVPVELGPAVSTVAPDEPAAMTEERPGTTAP